MYASIFSLEFSSKNYLWNAEKNYAAKVSTVDVFEFFMPQCCQSTKREVFMNMYTLKLNKSHCTQSNLLKIKKLILKINLKFLINQL